MPKKCIECGSIFKPAASMQKRCVKCRDLVRKIQLNGPRDKLTDGYMRGIFKLKGIKNPSLNEINIKRKAIQKKRAKWASLETFTLNYRVLENTAIFKKVFYQDESGRVELFELEMVTHLFKTCTVTVDKKNKTFNIIVTNESGDCFELITKGLTKSNLKEAIIRLNPAYQKAITTL